MSGLQGEFRISRHLRSLLSEVGAQLGVGILRSFLREVLTTVESPSAHLLCPPAPDLQDVVVLLEESLTAPQGEHRAGHAPPVVGSGKTLRWGYSSSISLPTRTLPFSSTLAQIPPRPFRACVIPGSVRRSMYRQTDRGPDTQIQPPRHESARRAAKPLGLSLW